MPPGPTVDGHCRLHRGCSVPCCSSRRAGDRAGGGRGRRPGWEFYTQGQDPLHVSPWYQGAHRIMIPFGCTRAPYYAPDPRCTNDRGFHHGIDIAMKCGTPLFARRRRGWVASSTELGPAYGSTPLRLRNYDAGLGRRHRPHPQAVRRARRPDPHRAADRAGVRRRGPGRLPPPLREAAARGELSSAVAAAEAAPARRRRRRMTRPDADERSSATS